VHASQSQQTTLSRLIHHAAVEYHPYRRFGILNRNLIVFPSGVLVRSVTDQPYPCPGKLENALTQTIPSNPYRRFHKNAALTSIPEGNRPVVRPRCPQTSPLAPSYSLPESPGKHTACRCIRIKDRAVHPCEPFDPCGLVPTFSCSAKPHDRRHSVVVHRDMDPCEYPVMRAKDRCRSLAVCCRRRIVDRQLPS